MSRQAHMELVINEGTKVDLGDTIFYVNNGTAQSHGDVQRKKQKDGTSKVILNCYRISLNDMEKNPDLTGEYNVPRYVNVFNKRIEPLLVCFKPEIRDNIIVKKPEDRQYFTRKQCELINGIARREGDQDSLEEVLSLSREEQIFWKEAMGTSENYFLEKLGLLDTV